MGKKPAPKKKPSEKATHQRAELYLELKDELEIVGGRVKQVGDQLKEALPGVPGEEVATKDGRVVYLQRREGKSFDWDAAKTNASPELLAELAPFVKKVDSLDLKAAERMLDMSRSDLQPFIVRTNSVALCVKPASKS